MWSKVRVEVKLYDVTELPVAVENSAIRYCHILDNYKLSNPSAQASELTVDTHDGYLVIRGHIHYGDSTDITLYFTESEE